MVNLPLHLHVFFCFAILQSVLYHFITIVVPPQLVPFDFTEKTFNSGDIVTVSCVINKGDFPIGVKWTHNENLIDASSGISVTRANKRVSQLNIESVGIQHSGEYVCAVKNAAGIAKQALVLHVNGT